MARSLAQPLTAPLERLLAETADLRERFERNPLFVRLFADRVDPRVYRHLLVVFHGYYHVLETLIRRRPEWLAAGPEALEHDKTAWLAADLENLGASPGPVAPLATLPGIHCFEHAVGACFVTEYLAWHGEVAEKHLRLALPRRCQRAVRFVTAYGRSREAQWQRLGEWLAGPGETCGRHEKTLRAARTTLAGLDGWLRDSLPEF